MSRQQDRFGPPTKPVEVVCLHCGKQYQSSAMQYEARDGMTVPLWWCGTSGCDGAGFDWDIFPVDSELGRGFVEELRARNGGGAA